MSGLRRASVANPHSQAPLAAWMLLCIAACAGLFALKHLEGLKDFGASPSDDSRVLEMDARITPSAASNYPELIAGGVHVDLGKSARVSFKTDARGVGVFDIAMGQADAVAGARFPMAMLWPGAPKAIFWNFNRQAMLTGLEPSARYTVEVAFWTRGYRAGSPQLIVTDDAGPTARCLAQCVAALGVPELAGLDGGAAWRRAWIAALGWTPWTSPGFLLLGIAVWRVGGRGWARKLSAAVGMDCPVAMPLAYARAG